MILYTVIAMNMNDRFIEILRGYLPYCLSHDDKTVGLILNVSEESRSEGVILNASEESCFIYSVLSNKKWRCHMPYLSNNGNIIEENVSIR